MTFSAQLLSDKAIEIQVVIILIVTVLNILIQVFKIKSDQEIMMKILHRDNSTQEFIKFICVLDVEQKLRPMKWCLFFVALAIAFIIIHLSGVLGMPQSDNYCLFIILFLISISFLTHYFILGFKLKHKSYV